jgi:hypothetical protein
MPIIAFPLLRARKALLEDELAIEQARECVARSIKILNESHSVTGPMPDMKARLEKLRTEAAECALIGDVATDPEKRGRFARLAETLSVSACDVESAVAAQCQTSAKEAGTPL